MSASVVLESTVLKPLLPAHLSEEYESEWPVFELTNAIVTDKAGAVANLFAANEENLLVLAGELVQRKEQSIHYKHGIRKKTVFVEVNPVGRYAFGSDEKGSIQIWAAGRSGWFELEPSLEYVATHTEMTEAVKLWYAILDSTTLQQATARDIFVPVLRPNNKKKRVAQSAAPEEVYRRHTDFLIEQMSRSLASWSKKPLYQYLLKLQNNKTAISSPKFALGQPNTQPITARTRETKRRGRPKRSSPEPRTPVKKEQPVRTPVDDLKRIETEGAVIWKFIQRGSERWPEARPERITLQTVGWMLHGVFIFDDEEQAIDYTRFQGPYLLRVMRERRQFRIWGDSPFYRELSSTVLKQKLIGRMAKLVLQVRDYEVGNRLAEGGLDIYASSDEDIQPHVTKSALRPKAAGKGKSTKGKSYTGSKDTDEDQASSGARMPKKRKVGIGDEGTRRSKRNRPETVSLLTDESSAESDAEKVEAQDSESEVSGGDGRAADKTLPLRWKSSHSKSSALDDGVDTPVIVKGPILDPQPNAPGDVWHCTVLGCMRTIYGASGRLGKRLIDDHIYEHREQQDGGAPQFSVVMNETKKTNLPVSNLIKKIREYAAAKELAAAMASADGSDSL